MCARVCVCVRVHVCVYVCMCVCVDMIFCVSQIIEKAVEHIAMIFMFFIDLQKAYIMIRLLVRPYGILWRDMVSLSQC